MYLRLISDISQLSSQQKSAIIQIYQSFSEGLNPPCNQYPALSQNFDYLEHQNNQIIACFGCDKRPTPHQIQWPSAKAYGWCIWDAFFICQLVGKEAVIHSTDPVLNKAVSVSFDGDNFANKELWFSFPIATVGDSKDLRSCFCKRVHGFLTLESAQEYAEENQSEVIDYAEMIKRTYAMIEALEF